MPIPIASILLAVACLVTAAAAAAVPAFPGAEGFGSESEGGRAGAVLYVNTLDDHDDGTCNASDCTLREAINQAGARMVLFKVGGTIVLDPLLGSLVIDQPYITIAGHTAPGDGIEIRNDPDGIDGLQTGHSADSFSALVIDTNDVVIRHVRIRPGPLTPNEDCTEIGAVANPPSAPNGGTCVDAGDIQAVDVDDASDVVLDHLSLGWASYIVTLERSRNLTLQNSILAEGLNYVQYDMFVCRWTYPPKEWEEKCHPEAFAGKGFMSGNLFTAQQGFITGQYTLHHNLFAHNSARNPQITVNCLDEEDPLSCAADVRNNVTYNWKHFAILSGNVGGHHFGNVVNNFARTGPDSISLQNALGLNDYAGSGFAYDPDAELQVYHSGNQSYVSSGVSAALNPVCGSWSPNYGYCPDPSIYAPEDPFDTPEVTTTSADQAYVDVLADAGASARLEADGSTTFNRDANDERVIESVLDGDGEIIHGYGDFPGFPSLSGGTPYTDTDADGMPDTWETDQCLNPNVANSGVDPDGDVYTNLEEFLNGTDAMPDHDLDGIPTGCDVYCSDGYDNDSDNKIDYPADPGCASASDTTEGNGGCGLLGIEVLPVLLFAALKRRTKRSAA
jgi:CSLREA domain-containing protein